MSRDHMKDAEFSEMCLKLPLTPIEDDSSSGDDHSAPIAPPGAGGS